MEIPNSQSLETQFVPQSSNKKKYIIVAIIIILLIIFVPLLFGLLTPTKKVTPSVSNTKSSQATTTTPTINPAENTIEPSKSITITTQEEVSENTQYQYQVEPTVDIDKLLPTTIFTPTPTPLPGPFYIANGQQNDLTYRLYAPYEGDIVYEVQLLNTRTREVRIIGYAYTASPGDSFFFSKDFSQVMFLGGKKTDHQKISFYSIPKKTILDTITLLDMNKAIPSLPIDTTSVLSRLVISPDAKKVAISYGKTYYESRIDPNTVIIVINLQTKKMQLLPVKGLSKNWKDNETLEYEISSSESSGNKTQEIKISNF